MSARLPHALAAVLAGAVLAGCGSSDTTTVTAPGPRPQLDPPQAAEPVTGPPVTGELPGRTVRVGAKPEGIAVDPDTHVAAVAVQSPDALVLLDDRTGRVLHRVPLPGQVRHVGLAKPGGPFLVPVETADTLVTVDPATGRELSTTKVGNHPHDAAAVGDRIFTADEFGSTISVVRGGKLVGQVPADAQPGGIAAVGDQVALIAVRAYTVELFSASDRPRGTGAQSAGLGPSHVVTGPSGRLAIADTRGQALIVYDTEPRLRFRGRIALGGTPVGLASDPGRGVVWTALSERGTAVAVDLRGAKPRITKREKTIRNPFSIGVDTDSGRLVVASRSDGTLHLLDP
ncbi:YncE family protein [Patulibacter minatonensis]|uniref:YncE family protein n=1 Tax=Patulibacter minatonensis TaxID=298163 RepID=UPI00047A2C29|nr:hypothetical protein [Patulibacter minatonensis]